MIIDLFKNIIVRMFYHKSLYFIRFHHHSSYFRNIQHDKLQKNEIIKNKYCEKSFAYLYKTIQIVKNPAREARRIFFRVVWLGRESWILLD